MPSGIKLVHFDDQVATKKTLVLFWNIFFEMCVSLAVLQVQRPWGSKIFQIPAAWISPSMWNKSQSYDSISSHLSPSAWQKFLLTTPVFLPMSSVSPQLVCHLWVISLVVFCALWGLPLFAPQVLLLPPTVMSPGRVSPKAAAKWMVPVVENDGWCQKSCP